ncbi:MAG: FAD-dependent thymidylate synthase [Alphaproteobacteria bacterium]
MSLSPSLSSDEIFSKTARLTVPALEDILEKPFPVLDHGFIRVVDYMGGDASIVQAARVSYGKGTKKIHEDRGLIRYLLRHRHTTPFEMCEIKFHIKLPIFIARQWIRHRTANVNEYSARYSIMDKEFYIPQPEHIAAQATHNRQGRGEMLTPEQSAEVARLLRRDAEQVYDTYALLLNQTEAGEVIDPERDCLARELARMNLTLNYYTQWYWKVDLHNLMHFLALRADPHAQYEIQAYARVMLDILAAWVPFAYEAFLDYRVGGVSFSASALEVIQRLVRGEKTKREETTMSLREWDEMCQSLGVVLD